MSKFNFFNSLCLCAYHSADKIVSLYYGARNMQIHLGAPEEKCRVIPNGVNMERFKNPDELVKEKVYYDIAEFDKFLASEDEDRYRILWETLYYCGLRIGEARGLQ